MYYDCNLYLFTFLVSYTVILVALIAVNIFYCVLMSMCREEVVNSKFGGILNFKPIEFLVSVLQVQTLSYSPMSGISL